MKCLALFDLSRRNWFHKSLLTSMVAIGLWKPYAKTKVGECITCSLTWQMVVVIRIKIPGIHFQDQNTEQQSNTAWKITQQCCLTETIICTEGFEWTRKEYWTKSKYKKYNECTMKICANRPKKTLNGNFMARQGGLFWLCPLRSEGSCDGQAGGWTSWEVAKDAQGRYGKQLYKAKWPSCKIA